MHVLMGLLGLVLTLAYTARTLHEQTFTGLFFPPALVLVGVAPLFIALTTYKLEELRAAFGALVRALRFGPKRSRDALYGELQRFAQEVRRQRPAEALAVAESASHPLLRQLAPLVVKQYDARHLEQTAASAAYCQASALKRSEEVFNTLARASPATGLVGTVLGLISLLKELQRFEQLGPSMALALLCTLYGLLLANGLYQPLARVVHSHAAVALEESRLLTRALALLVDGKSLADIRQLFELAHAQAVGPSPLPEGVLPAGTKG